MGTLGLFQSLGQHTAFGKIVASISPLLRLDGTTPHHTNCTHHHSSVPWGHKVSHRLLSAQQSLTILCPHAVQVMLGTVYAILKPFAGLFQKPVTAVLAIGGVVGGGILLKIVLQAMLGVTEPMENLSQGIYLT